MREITRETTEEVEESDCDTVRKGAQIEARRVRGRYALYAGREQAQECEHSKPSGGRVWPAAGWHSGVLLQQGNKPRFYQSKKKKKEKKNCSANYFRFPRDTVLLMMDRSLIRPEAPLPPHRSYFVMTLHPHKFFSLPSVNTTWEKKTSFSLFCLARFPQTNIHDTYSSWLQHPAGLTAPHAQSLPVVTKLGLFIIPHNKRRCGDVRTPRNEAQD